MIERRPTRDELVPGIVVEYHTSLPEVYAFMLVIDTDPNLVFLTHTDKHVEPHAYPYAILKDSLWITTALD